MDAPSLGDCVAAGAEDVPDASVVDEAGVFHFPHMGWAVEGELTAHYATSIQRRLQGVGPPRAIGPSIYATANLVFPKQIKTKLLAKF